jgi:hypothetical protein
MKKEIKLKNNEKWKMKNEKLKIKNENDKYKTINKKWLTNDWFKSIK